MALNSEASAALVFLILYAILFFIMIFGYLTRRLSLRSRFSVILFHVTVRLASQATGLAFGIVGYNNTSLLVAYFILGAEGYFTLVLCAYRFLISWQYHNLPEHNSWLEPRRPPGIPWYTRFFQSFSLSGKNRRPMSVIHNLLIAANAIIISGGSLLAGGSQNVTQFHQNLSSAKAMRIAGQAVFLSINAFLLYCIIDAIKSNRRNSYNGKSVHPTLYLLLSTWPLLFVRGLYGVLSGVLPAFNYFNPSNYGADGLIDSFLISEYIMGTTMEWTSCTLLLLTYFTSIRDPKKGDFMEENRKDGNNLKLEA